MACTSNRKIKVDDKNLPLVFMKIINICDLFRKFFINMIFKPKLDFGSNTLKNFNSFNKPNPHATYTRRTPSQSIHLASKLRYKQKREIKR